MSDSVLDSGDNKHIHALDRLHREPIVWLTTVGDRGQPQSSPVWFLWGDGDVLIFSRPNAHKLRNIAANPRVSLHLEGDGHGGEIVILEGSAQIERDHPLATEVADYIDKYRARIDRNGWSADGFARDYAVAVRISVHRARVW